MNPQRNINITVPVLARVEGEGGLDLHVSQGQITDMKFRIFEPPRFFEKFVEGREYTDIPDLVARICGLCPIAYQMSAVHAIESIFGVQISDWVRTMRRLIYCGEWLESHAVHIHFLAAPDFLGYPSAPAMAEHYPDEVRRGMTLHKIGNDLIRLLGGRSIHPIGIKVGGFFRAPTMEEVAKMRTKIRDSLPLAEELVKWTASLGLAPSQSQEFTYVGLRHPKEYPFNEGNLVSSEGLNIPITDYEQYFSESQVPHSTALYSHLQGKSYLVGPLARLNLNLDHLPAVVRGNLARTQIEFPSRNMFHSIVARAVEMHYALVEALRILDDYHIPESPFVPVQPRAGKGFGATEAPRGMLWQKWEVDDQGIVKTCQIVPPTSQNQARIEEDLRSSLSAVGLDKSDDVLRLRAETVIRNYDPCISCSTHFLKLTVHRD